MRNLNVNRILFFWGFWLFPLGLELQTDLIFSFTDKLDFPICTEDNGASKKLKILSYNIWNGFDWGKDTLRKVQLLHWVSSQQPDVVALQELCGYTPEQLAEDAKSWGHGYSVLLKTTGYSVGLTSSSPILVKDKLREGLHHGALHARTFGIDFLVIHLHPGSINRRREETQIILNKLEDIKTETDYYIVLGDFNGHSPFDADLYEANGNFLTRLRNNNQDKGLDGNLDHDDLDYAVLSGFLSLPLYDVVHRYTQGLEQRGTFPGRVLGKVNQESNTQLVSRLERIDYILVSLEMRIRCTNANVCNGEQNWFLSDHYPVLAEFESLKE